MKTIKKEWRVGAIFPGWMWLAGIIVFISIHGLYAQRTLPTVDQFNYATGPLQVVGVDWTRVSGSGNDLPVTEGNVACNGYLGALGRKATMANGANDDLKLSFTPQSTNGTTVYCAFVLNVQNITGLSSTGVYCYILGFGVTNFAARIYIRSLGAGYQLGISKTTTVPASWSAILQINTPHLVVMSYKILPGNSTDIASLWINPVITTVQPPADFSVTTGVDFGSAAAMDCFFLRQTPGSPNASVDDISIALSWGEIFQNPVYSETGTMGAGIFHNVKITGAATTITMTGAVSINSELSLADGGFYPSGNSVTFSGDGTLVYSGSFVQIVNPEEFPATNGPKNLLINNQAGVVLNINREISGDLAIAPGSKFTINPGISLTVGGNVILEGNESLLIRSDASGTGSFINEGAIIGSGSAKAERYLTGYENPDDLKYHFLSSPVNAQQIQPGFVANPPDADADFYKWDETTATWINSKDNSGLWDPGFGTFFETGRGYLVSSPYSTAKSFTGTLNNYPSSDPLILQCTFSDPVSGGGGGWNLLGNPYASAIDWNTVVKGSGIDNALYYYDAETGNYLYYIEIQPGVGIGTGSRYIPAMQGFMVHANNSGEKNIQIDNSNRVHQATPFYQEVFSLKNLLHLKVENESRSDELFMVLDDQADPGFDGRQDACKMFSFHPDVPQIWSLTDDGTKLAVNVLPGNGKNLSVRLGFQPGKEGEFRLTAEGTDSFEPGKEILIEDLKTGKWFNPVKDPNYGFSTSVGDDEERFVVHFTGLNDIGEGSSFREIYIYTIGNRICMSNLSKDRKGHIKIYSLAGQELLNKDFCSVENYSFPADLNKGLYLVQVIQDGHVIIEKIIIK